MLTGVARINEPLSRGKTKERGGCRCGYCFHGYKDVSFVATLENAENALLVVRLKKK